MITIAKVYDMFVLLKKMSAVAKKEKDQLDFINQLSSFAQNNGQYLDMPDYADFEDELVSIIEYANSYDYEYNDFCGMFDEVCRKFSAAADQYTAELESRPLISLLIQSNGEPSEDFLSFIEDLHEFYVNTVEAVFVDKDSEIPDTLSAIQSCKGRVIFPIDGNIIINDSTLNNLQELTRNNPAMGFFLDKNYTQFERDNKVITILKPAEENGSVEIELQSGTFGFRKDIFDFQDMLDNYIKDTDIQTMPELYTIMFLNAAKKFESVLVNSALVI